MSRKITLALPHSGIPTTEHLKFTSMKKTKKLREVAYLLWSRSPRRNLQRLLKPRSPTSSNEPSPSWCLSTGRVGTQTLAELANLSKDAVAVHEPTPKTFGLSKLSYQHEGDPISTETLQEAVRLLRQSLVEESGGRQFIETSPQCTFLAPTLARLFPKARFIHIVRHPASVIRSGMRRGWYAGHIADPHRLTPKAGRFQEEWPRMTPFQKNVWRWYETNRWILNFTDQHPAKTLLLRSEDIFSGDAATLDKFYQFLGVQPPSRREIESVLGMQLNSQKGGEFPTLQDWSQEDQEYLRRLGSDLAEEFGYPKKSPHLP